MEEEQGSLMIPLSPNGQYFSTSILSLSIVAVLESQVPLDDFPVMSLVKDVFLPINQRFSSVMVVDKNGVKLWKKVEVKIKDHIKFPNFPYGISTKFYDKCLNEYLSKIAMEQLPQSQPLWEIHIIKYPTSEAAGNIIFKLHHSLGDGFSLMGALLSCLQRADNPSIPLTFPSVRQLHNNNNNYKKNTVLKSINVSKFFSSVFNTVSNLFSNILISNFVEDDKSPIRSGHFGVEFLPVTIITMSFSLDHIKQIKTKLAVTINDVITGTIFLGTRLYMEAVSQGSGYKTRTTSLVLLNTRMFRGYKSVQEMVKPDAEFSWGNHFACLSVSIPKLNGSKAQDPLQFIFKAREIIKRKRSSLGVYITAKYLQLVKKIEGIEEKNYCSQKGELPKSYYYLYKAVSRYLYGISKNTSMGISNVMGPLEQMALANHPIKGLYFVVTGAPQSVMTGVISYMGMVRVAMQVEKEFIDPQKLKLYVENAFEMIFRAVCEL